MFITARKDLRLDGSHPTLLTGYGGYGAIGSPSYAPDVPLWLELGGVYALANIRGGGEYGEEWHLAGSRHRKQTSFDDFIAAAGYLRDRGYTRPARLAMYGHSNGGLLVGAMITQRPDLFAAAVPNAGHYDMLRYHRFTVGRICCNRATLPFRTADSRVLRSSSPSGWLDRKNFGCTYQRRFAPGRSGGWLSEGASESSGENKGASA
jgi:prolyl oligopeptidase